MTTRTEIAIVGAGFGGLGAAIRLRQRGYADFLVLEQAEEVGGTWRDNSYPGCACDVPSQLYSFSFAPNPEWTHTFSGQAEIWAYLRDCVDRFELRPHLRLGHRVHRMDWDSEAARWLISTTEGEVRAQVVIMATGPLSEPALPDIPGRDDFAGTAFHSARWNHGHTLAGRRVGVIGTGASAIQFVPRIQPEVGSLTIFQRTPPWILPRRDRPITRLGRAAYRHVPLAARLSRTLHYWGRESMAIGFLHPGINRAAQRIAERALARQVPDPALRSKLRPTYVLGCKRVLLSNDYLPALTAANVEVVTEAIREIRPHAVVTVDGTEHQVDTLIYGTGFHVTEVPMAGTVRGRDGWTLAEAWSPSMQALRGTTIAGFPNLFLLLGPNTGLGHTSVVLMIESQLRHILDVLGHLRRHRIEAVEPTAEAQLDWTQWIDRRMARTVWARGGCRSWYLDATGRNSTIWPGYATGFRLRLRRFRPAEYHSHLARPAAPSRRSPREIPDGHQGDRVQR